ncbi:probable E3 ubiquitin-protein ligase HERC4 isoform X2 [Actinia tenebrosa]|uniref:Probable E3 ubiquitin-protein ligase HERC4 isoform X2 n=1 Tax=Actinia tenebrosa TaxID=6105 RepID=A0A6P8I1B2_ACTTE|nr:probable E3 ubiquitin-protein ligase HERC4 isoform X2 [Actinia tenebrosa]
MFCWGKNNDDQLGLGETEEEIVTRPRSVGEASFSLENIKWLSCGWRHTAFLTKNNAVYTCGNNDYGQLGYEKEGCQPEHVTTLDTHSITQVSCGENHTLAVTDQGLVFSWGDNSCGQMGLGNAQKMNITWPRMIKHLAKMTIVQIACGANHCMALSKGGYLFSWGENTFGQLGIGSTANQSVPVPISSLDGVPFGLICVGGAHSFALSTSGALFGWGNNEYGQLGVHDNKVRHMPTLLRSLRSQQIRYVACGENHTAALTQDGGVFTFGCGSSGQLGHNSDTDENCPKKVFDLMGSAVTQIACGRSHTLAFVPSSNKIYAFGKGDSGQLGIDNVTSNSNSCVQVKGPWSPQRGNPETGYRVLKMMAGGDHCFVIADKNNDEVDGPADLRDELPVQPLLTLSESYTCDLVKEASMESDPRDTFDTLETIFSSQACLNGSFLNRRLDEKVSSRVHGIELPALRRSFLRLGAIPNEHIKGAMISSIAHYLIPSMLQHLPPDIEALRVYIILPEFEMIRSKQCFNDIVIPFGNSILRLSAEANKVLRRWWSSLPSTYFSNVLKLFQDAVRFMLQLPAPSTPIEIGTRQTDLNVCMEALSLLNKVNAESGDIVPFKEFYVPEIQRVVDIRADYYNWIQNENMFSFCRFPFVFDASAKTLLMQTDAVMQMQSAVDEVHRRNVQSLISMAPSTPIHPCLVILVHRENIVQDTLTQITKSHPVDLKKPLKVIFVNEEAVDVGGVRKEFFLLLLTELLDPKYGMFTCIEESQTIWFNDLTFEESPMFLLIGVICGLAIYNSTIINLRFPPVLYKKLLHRKPTLDDFRAFKPSVARNLQYLLDYHDDDVEDTFGLDFQVVREKYGAVEKIDLIPNGSEVKVTAENREQYVDAYIDYNLNKSVHKQFEAFSMGFHRVCGGRVLDFFHPQELMEMVVGCQEYDFKIFEKVAEYKGEYYDRHLVIMNFWDVFHEFPLDMKKQFLAFLTGSDRVPILGMESLKIIIQPVAGGEHGEHLPVAHTCFNLLDLPRYPTKEIMKNKLSQAIQYSTGFGLA